MKSKTGLALTLLLVLTLLVGCRGEDGDATSREVPKAPPSGLQALSKQGADRLETLKSRLATEPDNEQLLSELGDVYFEAKRFKEAIPVYERVVSINPRNADALNDLGLSLLYTGAGEEGLDAVVRATDADPTYKNAWLSKGFILLSLERYPEAIAPLNKVKELDPGGKLAQTADKFLEMVDEAQGKPRQ